MSFAGHIIVALLPQSGLQHQRAWGQRANHSLPRKERGIIESGPGQLEAVRHNSYAAAVEREGAR